jgi:hypothetical protein
LELWMFQILTLLAGLLPNTEIEMAAFVIGYVCCFVCFSCLGKSVENKKC